MEDPNLIATLIAVNGKKLIKDAFCLPHNKSRYLPPVGGIAESITTSSREPTPAPESEDERPKDIRRGYSFGTDPQVCDVLLGSRGAKGISGRHFCITFDEQRQVILRDSSVWGTAVSYDRQGKNEIRHGFDWLFAPGGKRWKNIVVRISGLKSKVDLASHEACQREFFENVTVFLEESQAALPTLDVLGMDSHQTTASASLLLTPRKFPIYLKLKKLGSGAFGSVEKVINASTGSTYAAKEFYSSYQDERNMELREQKRKEWQKQIRREVHIMKSNPHMHIAKVVDFVETPTPSLIMEYFPLGNLEDQHREWPITVEETLDLLFQCLVALNYLHLRNVGHRDLKPANLLVEGRNPLSIKLADFGLAKVETAKSHMKSFVGTLQYCAPEIYLDNRYTPSVDLWALGVIVLEYAYGLPAELRDSREMDKNQSASMKKRGAVWCKCIVDKANDWDLDPLIDLLTVAMLRIDPEERLSAGQCLNRGTELELFNWHNFDAGSAMPTQQTDRQYGISDDDDSSTIILETLWSQSEIADEESRRIESGSPRYVSGQSGGKEISELVDPPTTPGRRASSNKDAQFDSSKLCPRVSQQLDGSSVRALVKSRDLKPRRTSASAKKRDEQTITSSLRVSKQPKRRGAVRPKTDPDI